MAGALVYAGLKSVLSAQVTLYIQTFMPFLMLISYLFILGKPGSILPETSNQSNNDPPPYTSTDTPPVSHQSDLILPEGKYPISSTNGDVHDKETLLRGLTPTAGSEPSHRALKVNVKLFNKEEMAFWWSHVKYIPRLIKYMIPLFAVYTAEYMINQGLFELFYYPNTHIGGLCLDQKSQYRW